MVRASMFNMYKLYKKLRFISMEKVISKRDVIIIYIYVIVVVIIVITIIIINIIIIIY